MNDDTEYAGIICARPTDIRWQVRDVPPPLFVSQPKWSSTHGRSPRERHRSFVEPIQHVRRYLCACCAEAAGRNQISPACGRSRHAYKAVLETFDDVRPRWPCQAEAGLYGSNIAGLQFSSLNLSWISCAAVRARIAIVLLSTEVLTRVGSNKIPYQRCTVILSRFTLSRKAQLDKVPTFAAGI
ncbi:hypothetical protein ABIB90_007631 [Bradyrhizobium sp. JR4.1]